MPMIEKTKAHHVEIYFSNTDDLKAYHVQCVPDLKNCSQKPEVTFEQKDDSKVYLCDACGKIIE